MLLRNRSRAVTKPGLMADHSTSSQQPPNHQKYYARTIPSIFGSPKFRDFTNKCLSSLTGTTDSSSLRSPTSILDTTKALVVSPFAFANPFSSPHHNNKTTQKILSENNTISSLDSKCIGLALVGNLKDEAFFENCSDNNIDNNNNNQPNKGNVLFGTQLRVKIPPMSPPSTFSPQSSCVGGDDAQNPGIYAAKVSSDSSTVAGVMSLSEMELSEEYTRVISHGPNPRTTHIFNNCIVESYFSLPNKRISHSSPPGNNFLSFCYTCKKHLDQTKDIFIYRGEKAFCSPECRQREMVLDGVENSEF